MAVAVAVAVAVSGGGAVAVAVAVAGLTKRFFNHIPKNFLINIWGYPEKGNYYFIGNTISRNHYNQRTARWTLAAERCDGASVTLAAHSASSQGRRDRYARTCQHSVRSGT